MVVPLHTEQEWLPALGALPPFEPGNQPILFLSPHPDDESLATGGLLAAQRSRGVSIKLIAVTDGENAYTGDFELAQLRVQEQTLAAARLGIATKDILRLHLTDSAVAAQQQTLVERLLPLTASETHILAPWPNDFHPDHEACGHAALQLSRHAGARLTFYFFWTWHRGALGLLRDLKLQSFALNSAQQNAKAEAIAFHASQLRHVSGDPILHDLHLWPTRLPFEIYLPA